MRTRPLDPETRAQLLALGIPDADHSRGKLLALLPAPTRRAAAELDDGAVALLVIDLVAEGFAVPDGRSRFQPEEAMDHGTHACFFYRASEELISLVGRAFSAAVDRGEFCVWAVPRWLSPKEGARKLKQAAPALGPAVSEGRVEVIGCDTYLDGAGKLRDGSELLASWKAKEQEALARGFTAMLAVGDTSDLLKVPDVDAYLAYEHSIAPAIKGTKITGLCTYSLPGIPGASVGRVLYPHAHAVLAVGRAWQTIVDPHRGRDQLGAVLQSFLA